MFRYLRSLIERRGREARETQAEMARMFGETQRAAQATLIDQVAAEKLAAADGKSRSSRWPATRKKHLARNPTCAACGSKDRLEVHHLLPYHVHPELELVESNLLTLCEGEAVNCHLLFGHARSWSAWNRNAARDAAAWLALIRRARATDGEVSLGE